MQAALFMNPSSLTLSFPSPLTKSSTPRLNLAPSPRLISAKVASSTSDPSTVDYSSFVSVFLAEACETIGGDTCLADIYPEVKLGAKPSTPAMAASEPFDREYLDYSNPKTVFCAEACDDLGGEFCSPDYQKGVF